MAKYYGMIGFGETVETDPVNHPGVFKVVITERPYFGDVLSRNRKYDKGDGLNDDLNIRNEFSILSDPFATENFAGMRYLTWLGARWKITDVKIEYPRMILSVGGVYNGELPDDGSQD